MSNDISILRLCLTTPGVLTPVVVGPPGIGKTQRIVKLAEQLGWPCEVLSPGERGEGAFGVVPVPKADGYLHYPPPEWVQKFSEIDRLSWLSGHGLVFVDEINTAPPALQPALLGLILDGRIGGYQLPPGVRRVAAMNPTSQAASGWDLPPALANRMQYLTWNAPSGIEWTDWLLSDATHQAGSGWTKARALAAAYHRKNPGRILEDPDKVLIGRFPPAFCTPRSWETAIRMLAACMDTDTLEDYPMIAEGALGKPNAVEFCTWIRKNDLPDPEKLLADPTSWKFDPGESDKIFATCFAVAEAACSASNGHAKSFTKSERNDRWIAAWRVLGHVVPLGKGMIAIAARKLVRKEFVPDGWSTNVEVRNIVTSLKDVVQAAGLI